MQLISTDVSIFSSSSMNVLYLFSLPENRAPGLRMNPWGSVLACPLLSLSPEDTSFHPFAFF